MARHQQTVTTMAEAIESLKAFDNRTNPWPVKSYIGGRWCWINEIEPQQDGRFLIGYSDSSKHIDFFEEGEIDFEVIK